MTYLNPWSISNKTTAIYDLIHSENIDLLTVTESWLKADGDTKVEKVFEHEMLPKTHHMIHIPRPDNKRGGGIVVMHKKCIKVEVSSYSGCPFKQFEYAVCSLNTSRISIKLIIVYRPAPTKANNL